jgi:alpha-tubulin suppressor-like RCC1 family protein
MSKLYACGDNSFYQYGSSQKRSDTAVLVNVSTNALNGKVIKEITCGINYGFVITSENDLYGFGDNPHSNLGFKEPTIKVPPTKIDGTWKSFFANNNTKFQETTRLFTFFIDAKDKLYAAGDNTNRNLGIDPTSTIDNNVLTACKYQGNTNEVLCKNITCNNFYSVIINDNNEVYWCGTIPNSIQTQYFLKIDFPQPSPFSGTIKQVCINTEQTINSLQYTYLYLLTVTDTVTDTGDVYMVDAIKAFTNPFNTTYDQLNFDGEKVKKLSICNNNLAALTVNENIYVWGSNGYGFGFKKFPSVSIETNTNPTKINPEGNDGSNTKFKDVIAGKFHSLALTDDGKIYSCSSQYPIGNERDTTNFFNPIFPNGLLSFDIPTSKIALGYDTFLAISQDNAACFNEGTKILCLNCKLNCELNGKLNEIYRPVQDLQVGDFVKSYLHGYRKVNKILTGSFVNNPTDQGVSNCMYMMVKTKDNQLIDDLTLTRNHGILVEKLSENEERKIDKNTLPIIDNLLSIITADSDKFEKVMDNNIYKYYHFSLETDGDNDRRFGVYANGLLVETPSINMMNNALNIKPLDF